MDSDAVVKITSDAFQIPEKLLSDWVTSTLERTRHGQPGSLEHLRSALADVLHELILDSERTEAPTSPITD